MTPTDVPEVQRLLDEFLKRYDVAPAFSSEEVQHWFVPIEGVVESFVAEVGIWWRRGAGARPFGSPRLNIPHFSNRTPQTLNT